MLNQSILRSRNGEATLVKWCLTLATETTSSPANILSPGRGVEPLCHSTSQERHTDSLIEKSENDDEELQKILCIESPLCASYV